MKVLIVDDELLVRRSLRRAFEHLGHSVLEAADGVEGVRVWQQSHPDLVLLDVLMPGLTGPAVLKEMKGQHKATVILMSAYAGEYNLKKANELGADEFISKPFDDIFEVARRTESLRNSREAHDAKI